MQKIIQALFVTTLVAGLFTQKIVFDNSPLSSPCKTDGRSTIDAYRVTGTIGINITAALEQKWLSVVLINVLRTSQDYDTLCQLFLGIRSCQPVPTYNYITCECVYNTTTDHAHFTVSDTVQADDSHATMYLQWQHTNGTIMYPSKNYTFPKIHDVNAAQLSLTVAGVTGNLPSGSCSFSLTLNKSNNLELCCSNTAEPCYPHISFSRAVVTKNTSMCVTYQASQLASDEITENLVLSYSVCDFTDSRLGSNCTVTSKPNETATESTNSSSIKTATHVTAATTESSNSSSNVADDCTTTTELSSSKLLVADASTTTTEPSSSSSHTTDASTTTTELSSSSSHTTAPPPPDPVCDTKCIVVIVVVVVIISGVVAAVAIYCWKTKKRPKAVSNQGTNGNGDQAHTGVQHEKDRHNAEHRNQAYDGRRSSPSEVTIDDVKTTKYENTQQRNTAHEKDSNKPISDRTNDDNASQSVPGNPRQLPPLKETHTHGQLHPPAGSRPVSVETTSATAVKL